MSLFTRRGALAGLAGAATATLTGTALASSSGNREGVASSAGPSADLLARVRGSQPVVDAHPGARTAWATVASCRSWDHQVYLYVSDEVRGFVQLDDRAFAMAASAQAAGRRIAAQYWGHEPEWGDVGRFSGVLLAFDPNDLPITE